MAMRRPRAQQLRAMASAELSAALETLRQELWRHRQGAGTGTANQPHQARAIRRQIARTMTVLNAQRRAATDNPQGVG